SFTGGTDYGAYAQLGHGGLQASGSLSGAITITQAANLRMTGRSGSDAYAQVGHGSAISSSAGNRDGDIQITVNNSIELNLLGGNGALIGHNTSSGTITGNISLAIDQLDPLI